MPPGSTVPRNGVKHHHLWFSPQEHRRVSTRFLILCVEGRTGRDVMALCYGWQPWCEVALAMVSLCRGRVTRGSWCPGRAPGNPRLPPLTRGVIQRAPAAPVHDCIRRYMSLLWLLAHWRGCMVGLSLSQQRPTKPSPMLRWRAGNMRAYNQRAGPARGPPYSPVARTRSFAI